MKKEISNGIIQGISIFITLGICFISYAAWTNISTRSDGQTMTATYWNELVNNINTIGAKVDTLANIPSGAIIAFNLTTCPTGWVTADGTNSTPDLRGEFIRGLDNGRGVDAGRTLASAQGDAIRNITGQFGNGFYGEIGSTSSNGVFSKNATAGYSKYTSDMWTQNGPLINFDASLVVPTAPENRPRNKAFLYCIKQ